MTSVGERPPQPPTPGGGVASNRRGGHLARNIAIVVGVVLIVFIVVLATRPTADERPLGAEAVGRAVPPVAGETMDGGTFDIDRLRGEWVVVNFFAEWCVPCRVEHPELVAFSEQHQAADDGVNLVSVVFDDEVADVREFFAEQGGDWPVIVDEGKGRIALDFGVTGVPESYLVAPSGQVVQKFTGVTQAQLDGAIAAFEQPAAAGAGGGG